MYQVEPNRNPYLYVYIVAGIAGGIIFLTLTVSFIRRRQMNHNRSVARNDDSGKIQSGETLEVIHEYQSRLADEISLYVKDRIMVKVKFDDGWGFGYNVLTKQEGVFPLSCLGPVRGAVDRPMFYSVQNPEINLSIPNVIGNRYSSMNRFV